MIGFSDLDRFMWTYARKLAQKWKLTSVEIKANNTVYTYSCLETDNRKTEFYIKTSMKVE